MKPDWSAGDVIAAEPDGTIVLDDGITTWNPERAVKFITAKLEAENAGLHSRLDELCTKAVIHMEKANRFTYDDLLKTVTEARALLGEKP